MQDESEPLLGISWGSSNGDKVVPDLQAGRQSSAGQGPNSSHSNMATSDSDLAVLQELSGGRVIHDPEIDQMADLDGFAAQIGALDGVVAISNTTIDRLELYECAWQLHINAARLTEQSPFPNGMVSISPAEPSSSEPTRRGTASARSCGWRGFIAPVARQARRTIVLAEHRLVPLLRCSFAGADVRRGASTTPRLSPRLMSPLITRPSPCATPRPQRR